METTSQRGNILFLILLAVFLFAALSYAVTSSLRGSGKDSTSEKEMMNAGGVMEYAALLEHGVTRVMTVGGCTETQVSFQHSLSGGSNFVNPNAPADKHCHVFDPAGANVTPKPSIEVYGSYVLTNVGTGNTDLIYDKAVTVQTCMAINNALGIANNGVDGPPADKISAGGYFVGDYTIASTSTSNQTLGDNAGFIGRLEGCRINTGTGAAAIPRYYRVLLAR